MQWIQWRDRNPVLPARQNANLGIGRYRPIQTPKFRRQIRPEVVYEGACILATAAAVILKLPLSALIEACRTSWRAPVDGCSHIRSFHPKSARGGHVHDCLSPRADSRIKTGAVNSVQRNVIYVAALWNEMYIERAYV